MRGIRTTRTLYTGVTPTMDSVIISPRMENLSIGPIPSDSTNVVIASTNDQGVTDKLNALIDQYTPEIVRLPSTGQCASAITAKVPRAFLQSLHDMLNVNNNGCLQETQTFLQMLVSYLQSSSDSFINIPRNFWKQIGRVFNELNISESKINMYASIMRSMSMAISSNAQSLPSNNLLISTLESVSNLSTSTTPAIDAAFEANYPELILPQPDPAEVMTEVVTQLPTTIGESSSIPPTNMVDISASDASDNIQIHDLDDNKNIEAQAYIGLKDLFSTKTLCVPINQLKIVNNGHVKVTGQQQLTYVDTVSLSESGGVYTLIKTTKTATVLGEIDIDVSELDMSKTLLEQDWAVAPIYSILSDSNEKWVSTISMLSQSEVAPFDVGTKYRGLHTRRVYTYNEVRSIGSALAGLWKKVTSMKLPSPEHIQAGTSIIAAGLGAAGSIFGSSGLVTSSKIVSSISEGLGSFIADLQPTNGLKPEPKAAIFKNALSVTPSIIEAGKSIFEAETINAQQQRIRLNGMKKEVEAGYILTSTDLPVLRYRRMNNTFY